MDQVIPEIFGLTAVVIILLMIYYVITVHKWMGVIGIVVAIVADFLIDEFILSQPVLNNMVVVFIDWLWQGVR